MATASERTADRTDTETEFYIPAASIPATASRVETLLRRYLGGHDRIPIPRNYNR